MARILFAWELGGGLGHIGPFAPVTRQLIQQGHDVCLAVRDVSRVRDLYAGLNVTLFQSPTKTHRTHDRISAPATLPQVLLNVGYGDVGYLSGLTSAWRNLIELIRPDLIVADFAPSLQIAVGSLGVPVALIGNGFFCPSLDVPMRPLVAESTHSREAQFQDELKLVATVNTILDERSLRRIESFAEVYRPAKQMFLSTFAELDHYQRGEADYLGVWPYQFERTVDCSWPQGSGTRIFAYLKPSRGLGQLFDWVREKGFPTLVSGDGLDIGRLQALATPNLRFERGPLPIEGVGRECDIAILNGSHGTTCSFLLAGKPILQLPHNLEQTLTSSRTAQLGAGLLADKDDGTAVVWHLNDLIHNPMYREAARAFAKTYHDFNPVASVQFVADEISRIAGSSGPLFQASSSRQQ